MLRSLCGCVILGIGVWMLMTHRPAEGDSSAAADSEHAATTQDQGLAFAIEALQRERAESGNLYLRFLDRSTLSCGVYHLAAGSEDPQSPHREDEVYYALSGKAKLTVEGEVFAVEPGAVLFVAAGAEHRFHDIEEDLSLLVFFSKAPVSASE